MRDMMVFRFRPLDVLLFRDGHPFNTDVSFASTLSYPYPSTFSGAMRKFFGDLMEIPSKEWNSILGDASRSPLLFSGPFLEKDGEIYIRVPRVFLKLRKSEKGEVASTLELFSKIVGDSAMLRLENSSAETGVFWVRDSRPLEPMDGFVSAEDLIGVIEGRKRKEELKVKSAGDFFGYDVRTHIKITGKTVAEEGGKFSVRYMVLKDGVHFIEAVEKGSFSRWEELKNVVPFRSVVRLGGEGRRAQIERVEEGERVFQILERLRNLEDEDSDSRVFITSLAFTRDDFPVRAAVTSRANVLRGRNKDRVSALYGVYDAGSVFVFGDFKKIRSKEEFKRFRSLGFNMSLKGGCLL